MCFCCCLFVLLIFIVQICCQDFCLGMGSFHQLSLVKTSESTQFGGTGLALTLEITWNVLIYSISFFFFQNICLYVLLTAYLSLVVGFLIPFLRSLFFILAVTDLFRFLMSLGYVTMGRLTIVTWRILSTIWAYTSVLCKDGSEVRSG